MTEPVFVASNVLVYALDERDPRKRVAAWSWRQELWRTGRGRISFQVLQECYAQLAGLRHGSAGRSAGSAGVEAGGRGHGDS